MSDRERLITLVQQIMDGDYSSDGKVERLVAKFLASLIARTRGHSKGVRLALAGNLVIVSAGFWAGT